LGLSAEGEEKSFPGLSDAEIKRFSEFIENNERAEEMRESFEISAAKESIDALPETSRRWRERERSEYSSEPFVAELTHVFEDLLQALRLADGLDPWAKSVDAWASPFAKECLSKMAEFGFEEIKAKPGDPFKGDVHEAMGTEPREGFPEGSVSRLVFKGYVFHGRILRPAKVIVVKNEGAKFQRPLDQSYEPKGEEN
jgi:molecular chaperone GrpE